MTVVVGMTWYRSEHVHRAKFGPVKAGRAEIPGQVREGNDFDRKSEGDESLGEDVALDDSSDSDTVDTA